VVRAPTVITGAGATFPYPIYALWSEAYKKETGIGLNYQSVGSRAGIRQILARQVVFAASDLPLQSADLERDGLVQFPSSWPGPSPRATGWRRSFFMCRCPTTSSARSSGYGPPKSEMPAASRWSRDPTDPPAIASEVL
jgi:hypothetical protein